MNRIAIAIVVALVALVALSACGAKGTEMANEPWHLWGGNTAIQVNKNVSTAFPGNQLVHVDYHRPESWRFLIGAHVPQQNPANLPTLSIIFSLTSGVGRSRSEMPAFATIDFTAAELQTANGFTKYLTDTELPGPAGRVSPNLIEVIPAQSLYITPSVVGSIPNGDVTVQCFAYVSPNVHVRPDWFIRDFAGELKGM